MGILLPCSIVALLLTSRRSLICTAFTVISKASSSPMSATKSPVIRILLHGGDNMLGRAVQLTFPVQAVGEEYIRDSCMASHYLDMGLHSSKPSIEDIRAQNAEKGGYLWGHGPRHDTISPAPDVRLLNLETAVTKTINNRDVPAKGINYHMHADNYETVLAGFVGLQEPNPSPIIVSFSNNHCLDYGRTALDQETLPLMKPNGLVQMVGCGSNFAQAAQPAVIHVDKDNGGTVARTSVEIYAMASQCSGTPGDWEATPNQSGLVVLPSLYNARNVKRAKEVVRKVLPRPGQSNNEIRIVSIHWGPNWAMRGENDDELKARRDFAHWLIDECGVDLIYGHSSHHVRGMERYHNKLILYGAGDIINDYEGFENAGEEQYMTLGGIFVADLVATTGDLQQLRVIPTYMNQLRLERLTHDSQIWRPRQRRYEKNTKRINDFANFCNRLSKVDAGGDDGALLLEAVDADPQISGGPILRSQLYSLD